MSKSVFGEVRNMLAEAKKQGLDVGVELAACAGLLAVVKATLQRTGPKSVDPAAAETIIGFIDKAQTLLRTKLKVTKAKASRYEAQMIKKFGGGG